ncbi:MAG TPA: lysophospholipid acyltransferase family protein [Treponemataceae bacterium]|nr:lysophospholipid acyltransferase family protein [Treponemataceae bacterium]
MFKTVFKIAKIFIWIKGQKKLLKKAKKFNTDGKIHERDELVQNLVALWGKNVAQTIEADITIKGKENIPKDEAVVFIANHQGYADIIAVLGFIDKPTAFIAKAEIKKLGFIAGWMELMQCVFIERKNMRQSVQAMQQAIENVKKGYSLLIFPEGTRSKGGPIKHFKPGSFKLAFNSKAPIVPITIDGTWRSFEEKKRLRPANIILTIHPPVFTNEITKEERHAIPQKVQHTIESALPKTSLRGEKEVLKIQARQDKKES